MKGRRAVRLGVASWRPPGTRSDHLLDSSRHAGGRHGTTRGHKPAAYRCGALTEAWGTSCRAVLARTQSFFTQQLEGVIHNPVKCHRKLGDLEKTISKWREGKLYGKRPTVRQVEASVRDIVSAQFVTELF